MKQWLQSLQLSPAERNGSIVLMLLILGMLGIRLYLFLWQPTLPISNFEDYQREIAAFEADTLVELNAAPIESLIELPGIGPSMAERIVAYRTEIGGFSYLEQLMDIPGIGENKLNGLRPYVIIDTTLAKVVKPKPINNSSNDSLPYDTTNQWPIKLKVGETVELNSAKIEDFQRLPGIGLAFAQRIVDYRNKLGGFISVEQLREVSGVGEAKYNVLVPYLSLNAKKVKLLNINTATKEVLLAHPYCNQAWATELINNRPYTDLSQLPQTGLDKRILPYLTF